MKPTYTTNRQLQSAFRKEFKGQLDFRTIPDYSGQGRMYKTDTRVAFCDWLDRLSRDGEISDTLARNAHLTPRAKEPAA